VRQYDAHAWAEVWIEGRGWQRVDPTAAVAPERVEMSLADLFGDDDSFLSGSPLSLMRFRDIGLVNWFILRRDYFDYLWGTWVLGYDKQQTRFLQRLLGQVTTARVVTLFLFAAGISFLPWLIMQLVNRRRSRPDPRDLQIRKFCSKLARAGLPRKTGEGILDFAQRVSAEQPQLETEAMAIARMYVNQRYDEHLREPPDELRTRVRSFNPSRTR
jgi:hypothetical protein